MGKKINILGQDYFYILYYDFDTIFGYKEWTMFYKETKKYKRKKYYICGPLVECEKPIFLFKVNFSIENVIYTKSELKKILESKVELLNRKEEILKGELI